MDYEIRVEGHLRAQWNICFEGLEIIAEENGRTLLKGSLADQSALHGILKKLRDLGIPLVSLLPVEKKEKYNESDYI